MFSAIDTPGFEDQGNAAGNRVISVPAPGVLANDETCGPFLEITPSGTTCPGGQPYGGPATAELSLDGSMTLTVPPGSGSCAISTEFEYDLYAEGGNFATGVVIVVLDPVTYFGLPDGGDDEPGTGSEADEPAVLPVTGARELAMALAAGASTTLGALLVLISRRRTTGIR